MKIDVSEVRVQKELLVISVNSIKEQLSVSRRCLLCTGMRMPSEKGFRRHCVFRVYFFIASLIALMLWRYMPM